MYNIIYFNDIWSDIYCKMYYWVYKLNFPSILSNFTCMSGTKSILCDIVLFLTQKWNNCYIFNTINNTLCNEYDYFNYIFHVLMKIIKSSCGWKWKICGFFWTFYFLHFNLFLGEKKVKKKILFSKYSNSWNIYLWLGIKFTLLLNLDLQNLWIVNIYWVKRKRFSSKVN